MGPQMQFLRLRFSFLRRSSIIGLPIPAKLPELHLKFEEMTRRRSSSDSSSVYERREADRSFARTYFVYTCVQRSF